MASFGSMLRVCRRQCSDPLRGGLLTQERLGELLGYELGHTGYSGAAVSDWERDKSKIDEDDRPVLVGLVNVLYRHGGLMSPAEANELLHAGNYRGLDRAEERTVFPESIEEASAEGVRKEGRESRLSLRRFYAPETSERRKQLILLEKVKSFWIQGVLEQSLRDAIPLEIAHQRYDDAVDQPWRDVLGAAVLEDLATQSVGKTIDVFKSVDRALLILGSPGSGKTTTLLTLAQDLIAQAEADPTQPIPVILSLVSWAERRGTLTGWLVEELTAKYQIPRRIGRNWLDNAELLLLLDGFDEVPLQQRVGCAAAINQFRSEHGLTGIAVCSRIEEYESTSIQLRLGGAILLQPLSQVQVDDYLTAAEAPVASLRAAVRRDAALQETVRSPLMLNVMRAAYSYAGQDQQKLAPSSKPSSDELTAKWRQHLFTGYIESMFRRRYADPAYSRRQITRWLAWLSRKMSHHNRSVFFVEQLQPSWLSDRRSRWLYLLVSRLLTGILGGIIVWLMLLLLRRVTVDVPSEFSARLSTLLQISLRVAEPLVIIGGNIALALLVGIINGLYFERRRGREYGAHSEARQDWQQVGIVGLLVGFCTFAVLVGFDEPLWALSWAIAHAVLYMVISRFVHGRSFRTEVSTVEALGWSWRSAVKGLGFALVLAVITEVIEAQLYGYEAGLRTVLMFGLVGVLLGGLRGRRVEETTRPNQGIWLSVKNALVAASVLAFSLGALMWLLHDITIAGPMALLMLLLVALLYGGSNVSKHFLVRFFLWRKGHMPWNYVRFLDYSAGLVFLRKVGGGYMFVHHMLMAHFAGLDES